MLNARNPSATVCRAHLLMTMFACNCTRSALLAPTDVIIRALVVACPGTAANVPAGAFCCLLNGHGSAGRIDEALRLILVLTLMLLALLQRQC